MISCNYSTEGMMGGREGGARRQAQRPGLKSEKQGGPLRFGDLATQTCCAHVASFLVTCQGEMFPYGELYLNNATPKSTGASEGWQKIVLWSSDSGHGHREMLNYRNCYQTQISTIFLGQIKKQSEEWLIQSFLLGSTTYTPRHLSHSVSIY